MQTKEKFQSEGTSTTTNTTLVVSFFCEKNKQPHYNAVDNEESSKQMPDSQAKQVAKQ